MRLKIDSPERSGSSPSQKHPEGSRLKHSKNRSTQTRVSIPIEPPITSDHSTGFES